MAQAEVVKEGCSIYNRSESCPGKGAPSGLSQFGGREQRCPQPEPASRREPASPREKTVPTSTWVQCQFCPQLTEMSLPLSGPFPPLKIGAARGSRTSV